MALKSVVDKLDDVTEGDRGHYTEIEDGPLKGKFAAVIDDFEEHPGVAGLKTTLGKIKPDADLVGEYRKLGLTPKQISEMIESSKKMDKQIKELREHGDGVTADKLEKLRKEFDAEKEEAVGVERKRADELQSREDRRDMREKLRKAAKDGGVLDDELEDAVDLAITRGFAKYEDGSVVIYENGESTTKTAKRFFTDDWRKMKPTHYAPREASGGGSKGGERIINDPGPGNRNSQQKIAAGIRKRKEEGTL